MQRQEVAAAKPSKWQVVLQWIPDRWYPKTADQLAKPGSSGQQPDSNMSFQEKILVHLFALLTHFLNDGNRS